MSNLNQPFETRAADMPPTFGTTKNDIIRSTTDIEPFLAMWQAAAKLMIEDAVRCSKKMKAGKAPADHEQKAYRDILELGPTTRHLARFCLVGPEMIQGAFRKAELTAPQSQVHEDMSNLDGFTPRPFPNRIRLCMP